MKSTTVFLSTLAALCCLPALAATAPTAEAPAAPAQQAKQHPAKDIKLAVGEKHSFTLDVNPTTGYTWMVGSDSTPGTVYVDIEVLPNATHRSKPAMCGAPTKAMIAIIAEKPGKTTVELCLARPWEKVKQPAETMTIQVEVTEAPAAK